MAVDRDRQKLVMTNLKPLRIASLAVLALAAVGARAELIWGITTTSQLVSFDSANANAYTLGPNLSGVVSGHTVRAIDFRASNGQLYAISSNASTAGQLYTVNLTTGALTAVGSTFGLTTTSTRISMDFNPVVDAIRVVAATGNNLRVNADTGVLINTDTNIAYVAGDPNATTTAQVGDIAYTNNVAGASTTTLFAYDFSIDNLATIGTANGAVSPNTGQLNTVGSAGGPVAFDLGIGFDISGSTGVGYLSMDEDVSPTSADELYSVNLSTGALTLLANEIGVGGQGGLNLLDISVVAAPVPEPATMVGLGLGAIVLLRKRRKA